MKPAPIEAQCAWWRSRSAPTARPLYLWRRSAGSLGIAVPSLWWSGGLWPLGLDGLGDLRGAQIESPRQGGIRCINTPAVKNALGPIRGEFEDGPTSM
jgi:hypothetical protein